MAELNDIRCNLRNAAQEGGPGARQLSLAQWVSIARIQYPDATEEQVAKALEPARGGPEECPRRCTECAGEPGEHHFSEAMVENGHASPEHEAAKMGIEAWYECKHCDAWLEYGDDEGEADDECDDEPDSEDEPERVFESGSEAGWYYGFGGYEGDPDYDGPGVCQTRKEADGRYGINYEVAGPFVSKAAAQASVDTWLASVEDEEHEVSLLVRELHPDMEAR